MGCMLGPSAQKLTSCVLALRNPKQVPKSIAAVASALGEACKYWYSLEREQREVKTLAVNWCCEPVVAKVGSCRYLERIM